MLNNNNNDLPNIKNNFSKLPLLSAKNIGGNNISSIVTTNINNSQNRRFLRKKNLKYKRNITPNDPQPKTPQGQSAPTNSRNVKYILYKLVLLLSWTGNLGCFIQ